MSPMTLPRGYDRERLQGPEEFPEIGHEDGEECGRYHELDEDAPRRARPWRCQGTMTIEDSETVCDTCGEIGGN